MNEETIEGKYHEQEFLKFEFDFDFESNKKNFRIIKY